MVKCFLMGKLTGNRQMDRRLMLMGTFSPWGVVCPCPGAIYMYCKFGNFRVTFISRIFYFRIIGEVLNSRTDTCTVYKAYYNSLLARILFSRGNEFANISEN